MPYPLIRSVSDCSFHIDSALLQSSSVSLAFWFISSVLNVLRVVFASSSSLSAWFVRDQEHDWPHLLLKFDFYFQNFPLAYLVEDYLVRQEVVQPLRHSMRAGHELNKNFS